LSSKCYKIKLLEWANFGGIETIDHIPDTIPEHLKPEAILSRCDYMSKKRNWFPKMDPMHRIFSIFSTNNLSYWFALFHHALKRSMI